MGGGGESEWFVGKRRKLRGTNHLYDVLGSIWCILFSRNQTHVNKLISNMYFLSNVFVIGGMFILRDLIQTTNNIIFSASTHDGDNGRNYCDPKHRFHPLHFR